MSYKGEHKRDSRAAVALILVAAALIALMLWMNGPPDTGETAKLPTRPGESMSQNMNANGGR